MSAFKRVSELEGVFLISCCFRILEMFHSICLLLRLPPFCDFQTTHQVVILVRLHEGEGAGELQPTNVSFPRETGEPTNEREESGACSSYPEISCQQEQRQSLL